MSFVLDCSVAMAWVFADERNESTDALRESLVQDNAVVPALWPIEVGNVLLVATRRGRITKAEWPRVCDDLLALPIDIDPVSSERVLRTVLPLAETNNVSVYDAMYLELALRLGMPLATLDQQLAAAGKANGLVIL